MDSKKINQLALRNLKLNLGTGLNHFIQFKKEVALEKKNYSLYHKLNDLNNFLQFKLNRVRSAQGWIELWNHSQFGKQLRLCSVEFFGK